MYLELTPWKYVVSCTVAKPKNFVRNFHGFQEMSILQIPTEYTPSLEQETFFNSRKFHQSFHQRLYYTFSISGPRYHIDNNISCFIQIYNRHFNFLFFFSRSENNWGTAILVTNWVRLIRCERRIWTALKLSFVTTNSSSIRGG